MKTGVKKMGVKTGVKLEVKTGVKTGVKETGVKETGVKEMGVKCPMIHTAPPQRPIRSCLYGPPCAGPSLYGPRYGPLSME
jgi:hypothetical protein